MDSPQEDGRPLREHLKGLAKRTGKEDALFVIERQRPALIYLWNWWRDLSFRRGYNAGMPLPVPYSEIRAWAKLTGTAITPKELEVIDRIEGKYFKVRAKGAA